MAAKKDLGTKLSCQSCGAKFYDLKKKTPVCPKCDTEFVAVKPRTRRASIKAAAEPEKAPEPAPAAAAEKPANDDAPKTEEDAISEVEVEVEDDDEEDNSLMEDTSDIGGDEEDVAGVIDGIDTAKETKDTLLEGIKIP
ncbi:MAG: FYDLN acid domain-containing protein [Rhodospirillales bacterium]